MTTRPPQHESTELSSTDTSLEEKSINPPSIWSRGYAVITYTPTRCRYDLEKKPTFGLPLNLLFGLAGTVTVANLYYNHPILKMLADEFGVDQEKVSLIPTLMQAGYATGLLFLAPLGDLFRRRAFVLILIGITATLWLGLCITSSFSVFCAISFLSSVTTVTPQLMMPLVADLVPAHRRAAALSVVTSGLLLGLLMARVLSGIVSNYTSWREIYWISFGLQYLVLILLWFFMPDYPSANPAGLSYSNILWTTIKLLRHPLLVQACIIGFFTASTFTSFWTTLTFLLSAPPYSYPTTLIGLFALLALPALFLGPLYSKHVIDRFVPQISVITGNLTSLAGILIGTFIGTFTVAGPIIQAFLGDFGMQISQIALRKGIYEIDARMRNRINTCFMLGVFCGQLMGTAVGNHMFVLKGWRGSGGVSVGFVGLGLVVCLLRGPWERGWIGWGGGWGSRRKNGRGVEAGGGGGGVPAARSRNDVEYGNDEMRSGEEVGTVDEARKDGVQVGEGTIDEKARERKGRPSTK